MSDAMTKKVTLCHDIQVSLGNKSVNEYEAIPEIGMMVRLALHIRGLPLIKYDNLKLVADHFLQISPLVFKNIIKELANVDFIRIDSEGATIKSILPMVPYFDDVYSQIGEYAIAEKSFNEHEQLIIEILSRLYSSPAFKGTLFEMGAEKQLTTKALKIGKEGGFLVEREARGKDIILSPVYFMENAELYADIVAKSGSKQVQKVNDLLKRNQGWPLSLIERRSRISDSEISPSDVNLIKRLAQDGAVKPPSISTPHAGVNYFMFTPTPSRARLHTGKKEIYERALAIVSAVRQGQLLPKEYAIRNPIALLSSLKQKGFLQASTEAFNQYKRLSFLHICTLRATGGGFYEVRLSEAPENNEALDIAISLIENGDFANMEVDEEAITALRKDSLEYTESIRSSAILREREQVPLSHEQKEEIENLLLAGGV